MSGKGKAAAKAPAAKPAAKPAAAAKKAAPAPAAAKKPAATGKGAASTYSHLFEKNTRQYGIGRALPPTKNMSRFVLWPTYIRLQRHKAVLKKRLKVPPALNQFNRALDKNHASTLFRLLAHYRPESPEDKKKRLFAAAKAEADKQEVKDQGKPYFVKHGLNHITSLVESKKAKLVIIAHDVDPIELVVWLPALCRKMNVPYVIVKGKARLGHVVHKKTASVLALTEVRKEDAAKLEAFVTNANIQFKDNTSDRKKWGGGVMGAKTQAVLRERARIAAKEAAKGRK